MMIQILQHVDYLYLSARVGPKALCCSGRIRDSVKVLLTRGSIRPARPHEHFILWSDSSKLYHHWNSWSPCDRVCKIVLWSLLNCSYTGKPRNLYTLKVIFFDLMGSVTWLSIRSYFIKKESITKNISHTLCGKILKVMKRDQLLKLQNSPSLAVYCASLFWCMPCQWKIVDEITLF